MSELTPAEKLVAIYAEAQEKLTNIIKAKATRGSPALYERRLLRQVNEEIRRIRRETPEVVRQLVLEAWQQGYDSLLDDLAKAGVAEPDNISKFSKLNVRNIQLLSENIIDDFTKAVNLVGRHMRDEIRNAGLSATASKEASGRTVKSMKKDLEKRLLGIGDTHHPGGTIGVKYKNGVITPLDKYSMMVARTTPAEAQNKVKIVQGGALGYDLVRMTSHAVTCPVCAKYQGRVYALTDEAANGKYKGPNGEPLRFPLLYKTVLHHGYETVHPNCRHRFSILPANAYTPAELAEFSRKSLRPFEDLRSDDARKAYAREQAENRQRNEDRKQFARYQSRLGEVAPKSFSAFRHIKKAAGDSWGILQSQYKGMGYYVKSIEAEPEITQAVKDNALSGGMDPVGLDFRIKSKESFLRKIRTNYEPDGNEYEIKDILRYTLTSPAPELAEKTLHSLDTFSQNGYTVSEVKNYWLKPDNPYNGVNTVLTASSGQKFEMQYHTPASFAVKDGEMHRLYEQWRSLPKGSPERVPLEERMKKLSEPITRPPGIERVK